MPRSSPINYHTANIRTLIRSPAATDALSLQKACGHIASLCILLNQPYLDVARRIKLTGAETKRLRAAGLEQVIARAMKRRRTSLMGRVVEG
jgi:hypothetical protein